MGLQMFRPNKAAQMTTPLRLQAAETAKINGVNKKTYKDVEGNNGIIWVNFATYGGTETTVNGLLVVEETATITTWYRPDIKSDCRVKRLTDNAIFEIIGEPENVEMRNMILIFKVRRVKGGV